MPEINELDRVIDNMADELIDMDEWAKSGNTIPFGYQKMTPSETARKWNGWSQEERMEFIKQNGIDTAMSIAEKAMKNGK